MKSLHVLATGLLLCLSLGAASCTIITDPNTRPVNTPAAPPPPPPPVAPTATTTTPAATTRTPAQPHLGRNPPKAPPFHPVPHFQRVQRPMTAANLFGEPGASAGALTGTVYYVPANSTQIPDLNKLSPVTQLYTKAFNIGSQPFTGGFPGVSERTQWFAIRYSGEFAVTTLGDYRFRLVSDDGSRLYIDNAPLINNDGLHAASSRTESIRLAPGVHRIVLDYLQGQSPEVSLQLFVTGPDGAEKLWAPAL